VTFLRTRRNTFKQCGLDEAKENGTLIKLKPGRLPGLPFTISMSSTTGRFNVFLNAKWTDTCGNSCYILMNGPEKGSHDAAARFHTLEDQAGMITEKNYKQAWHPLKNAGELVKFELKKGPNRIELAYTEDGPKFYQLVVSTEASTPVGGPMKRKS